MSKDEIIKELRAVYERAFASNDMHLCLEILREIMHLEYI